MHKESVNKIYICCGDKTQITKTDNNKCKNILMNGILIFRLYYHKHPNEGNTNYALLSER